MCNLSRDQESDDCFFTKSFARLQPMKPLDQNEAVFVRPNENWSLLSDFQDTLRDFLNHFRIESFPPLHGNVDLVDWVAFRFEHSFYSVVTEPHPKHQAPDMALRRNQPSRSERRHRERGHVEPGNYTVNSVQLRTARSGRGVTTIAHMEQRGALGAPHSFFA